MLHMVAFVPEAGFERVFEDRAVRPELARYFRLPALAEVPFDCLQGAI